jgi:hypothetical protein
MLHICTYISTHLLPHVVVAFVDYCSSNSPHSPLLLKHCAGCGNFISTTLSYLLTKITVLTVHRYLLHSIFSCSNHSFDKYYILRHVNYRSTRPPVTSTNYGNYKKKTSRPIMYYFYYTLLCYYATNAIRCFY